MKIFNYLFTSIYFFYESINDGRPGNIGKSGIASIVILTLFFTFNILSFFPTSALRELKWLFYLLLLVNGSLLTLYFYRKKRYLKIVNEFSEIKNKEIYYIITITYIILSFVIFMKTR